jgi:hypothetical protein
MDRAPDAYYRYPDSSRYVRNRKKTGLGATISAEVMMAFLYRFGFERTLPMMYYLHTGIADASMDRVTASDPGQPEVGQ